MPQLQVVDTTPRKPEPTGVEQFFSKLAASYKEGQDVDTIGNIIKDYQSNREKANAWEDAYLKLQNSNISPSRRLEAQKSLLDTKKVLIDQDKALNAKYKAEMEVREKQKKAQDEKDETQRGVEALEKAGASQKQIDLFKASPVGGKTKVIGSVLESLDRQTTPAGTVSPEIEDYDKGLTPKERVKRQEARYSAQSPILMKNSETLHGLENEHMSLGLLQELDDTGRVGAGLHNLNINPKTGELFIPKLGTPEEQLFVKTVNDFTVKAKDSFGARVTNFELDRFMQRLPTLANSQEGRRLIIRQMQIINQLNAIEKKEIQRVFDQYGVRNIDYADAETKARKAIEGEKEQLRKEYYDIEQVAKQEDSENLKKIKENVPEGFTSMRKPDGTIKMFPTKNVPALEEKGYKKI